MKKMKKRGICLTTALAMVLNFMPVMGIEAQERAQEEKQEAT